MPPHELVDFELMREMGWSWEQLEATPAYVRRYCWDLLQTRHRAEQDQHDRAVRAARSSHGH